MLHKKANYTFDSSGIILQDGDLLDVKTAEQRFVGYSSKGSLDMSGFRINNLD